MNLHVRHSKNNDSNLDQFQSCFWVTYNRKLYITYTIYTVEPQIVDPPRKGQCMLDLHNYKGHCQRSQTLHSLQFQYIENLREEDNLSIKDKTAEFILFLQCPLFRGSTVIYNIVVLSHPNLHQQLRYSFRHLESMNIQDYTYSKQCDCPLSCNHQSLWT